MNKKTDTTKKEAALQAAIRIQSGDVRAWTDFMNLARPFMRNLSRSETNISTFSSEDFFGELEIGVFKFLPKARLIDETGAIFADWDYILFISSLPLKLARRERKAWEASCSSSSSKLRRMKSDDVYSLSSQFRSSDLSAEAELYGEDSPVEAFEDWTAAFASFLTPEQSYLVTRVAGLGASSPFVEVGSNITNISAISVAAANLGIDRHRAAREYKKGIELVARNYYGLSDDEIAERRALNEIRNVYSHPLFMKSEARLASARASFAAEQKEMAA